MKYLSILVGIIIFMLFDCCTRSTELEPDDLCLPLINFEDFTQIIVRDSLVISYPVENNLLVCENCSTLSIIDTVDLFQLYIGNCSEEIITDPTSCLFDRLYDRTRHIEFDFPLQIEKIFNGVNQLNFANTICDNGSISGIVYYGEIEYQSSTSIIGEIYFIDSTNDKYYYIGEFWNTNLSLDKILQIISTIRLIE